MRRWKSDCVHRFIRTDPATYHRVASRFSAVAGHSWTLHLPWYVNYMLWSVSRYALYGLSGAWGAFGLAQFYRLQLARRENVRQKKKEENKNMRKMFRSERTVNFGPKSQRFLNQKVFVFFLFSAPFTSMLRRRRAGLRLVRLVFVPWRAQPAPGDTSTFLAFKNRLENSTLGSLFWVKILPTLVA